jgi:hypothetical protein
MAKKSITIPPASEGRLARMIAEGEKTLEAAAKKQRKPSTVTKSPKRQLQEETMKAREAAVAKAVTKAKAKADDGLTLPDSLKRTNGKSIEQLNAEQAQARVPVHSPKPQNGDKLAAEFKQNGGTITKVPTGMTKRQVKAAEREAEKLHAAERKARRAAQTADVEKATKGGPGLSRMQASGNAETIRKQNLAEQKAGRKEAFLDGTITRVAKENPKKTPLFDHYKSGMTVREYLAAICKLKSARSGKPIKEDYALAIVKWDLKKGWIRVTP